MESVILDLSNEADFEKLPKTRVEGVILLVGFLSDNAPMVTPIRRFVCKTIFERS